MFLVLGKLWFCLYVSHGLAAKLVRNAISVWRTTLAGSPRQSPTRAGLFGNTTVHIPHILQGFNNDITCLQHSLFLFISPEKTKLGLFQRAQAEIFRSSVSLILSPKLFPLLSSVAPPFSICRDKRENSIATGLHPGTEENEARQTTEK